MDVASFTSGKKEAASSLPPIAPSSPSISRLLAIEMGGGGSPPIEGRNVLLFPLGNYTLSKKRGGGDRHEGRKKENTCWTYRMDRGVRGRKRGHTSRYIEQDPVYEVRI